MTLILACAFIAGFMTTLSLYLWERRDRRRARMAEMAARMRSHERDIEQLRREIVRASQPLPRAAREPDPNRDSHRAFTD